MPKRIVLLSLLVVLPAAPGCVVPQPRGSGQYLHVEEPLTHAWYHLYLPVDYVRNGGKYPNNKLTKWPLVMTFHGMKPYDNALPQEREWEKQADIYGYIIVAPELATSDSFMEYPLTTEHSYVLTDKRNVLAIMDHVFATTRADPKRVLSTSWSCGGYLAHYFPNRFPDRFSCIATRLSNFSSELMVEESVPLYRDKVPVAMFIGDGDFPACKYESEEAVAWYTARGFRVVRGKMIDHMGHRRIPQTAAAFFAEQLGIEPLRPLDAARSVAEVQMTEYYPSQDLLAKFSPRGGALLAMAPRNENGTLLSPTVKSEPKPAAAPAQTSRANFATATAGRKYPSDRRPSYDPTPANNANPVPATKQSAQVAQSAVNEDRSSARRPPTAAPDRSKNWLEAPKQPPERREVASAEQSARQASKPNATPPTPKSAQDPSLIGTSTPHSNTSVASAGPVPGPLPTRSGYPDEYPPGHASPKSDQGTVPKSAAPSPKSATPKGPAKSAPQEPVKLASAARNNEADRRGRGQSNKAADPNFSPQNAGRRDYDRLMEARPHDPAYTPALVPRTSTGTVASAPKNKAQHVNVRISGPAIGTAPHYLRYSVDLPRDKTQGADFLWLDNGVWMGDEASGAKILDSPGLHFITVLVVTRDEVEYRGQAKVQVLERTASTFKGEGSPG